ncbi:RNA-binding protein [Candidatus Woesearchaeota archaeon]|nr:RNA-binding protein [Candidatus Woesearchaeota archaeon]
MTKEAKSKLLIKDKEIAAPGEVLATGMDFLPSYGTYRLNNEIMANKLGVASVVGKVIKIIPVAGRYPPKRGDVVIGKVIDVTMNGWIIDINCAYDAMMNVKDATSDFIKRGENLTRFFKIGDHIVAQITNVTSQKLVDLTVKGHGLRKIFGGRLIEVNTHKVPRIIGKQGSMVTMIKQTTGCNIIVGQNGWIWLSGTPEGENLAVEAIKKIERESHLSGLTDKIKSYLEKNKVEVSQASKPVGVEKKTQSSKAASVSKPEPKEAVKSDKK